MVTFFYIICSISIFTVLLALIRIFLAKNNIIEIDEMDMMADDLGCIVEILTIVCLLSWVWIIYCIFC